MKAGGNIRDVLARDMNICICKSCCVVCLEPEGFALNGRWAITCSEECESEN